ncbi:MAG: hypothetical protein ACT4PO_14160 [Actinomycetota bacterium]
MPLLACSRETPAARINAYLTSVHGHIADLADPNARAAKLIGAVGTVGRLPDDDVRVQAIKALQILIMERDEPRRALKNSQPPRDAEKIHSLLVEAEGEMDQAIVDCITYLRDTDDAELRSALAHAERSVQLKKVWDDTVKLARGSS